MYFCIRGTLKSYLFLAYDEKNTIEHFDEFAKVVPPEIKITKILVLKWPLISLYSDNFFLSYFFAQNNYLHYVSKLENGYLILDIDSIWPLACLKIQKWLPKCGSDPERCRVVTVVHRLASPAEVELPGNEKEFQTDVKVESRGPKVVSQDERLHLQLLSIPHEVLGTPDTHV